MDNLSIEVDRSSTCRCGWLLPLSVFAYSHDVIEPTTTNHIKRASVCLVCPKCRKGHQFFDGSGEPSDG